MTREERIDRQRRIAAIDRQMAELLMERARIQDELADDKVDATTGKAPPRRRPVTYAQVSELDQVRASRLLTDLENRRRARS